MFDLDQLTIEEKVGQLFNFGFSGYTPSDEIVEFITQYHIGGVIFFAGNVDHPEQVLRLSNEVQQLAKVPLIIAVDQEGGMVTRIQEGITKAPSSMAIGAAGNPEYARMLANYVGEELRNLGMNMNYAPCVDVNNNPYNPVIGIRSFGDDPELVARMSVEAIKGYQESNCSAVAKHFPGHGDTNVDSHLDIPVVNHSRERLEEVELYPFKKAIENGVDAIMVSHVVFPSIEEKKIPATLSKKVITDLLRKELHFDNVIMTDCMYMKAISDNYDPGEAAIQAIEAGNDIILISRPYSYQKASIDAVLEAVHSGRISEERINESVRRIFELKRKRQVDNYKRDWEDIKDKLATEDRMNYSRKISEESITVIKHKDFFPLTKNEKVAVVWTDVQVWTGVDDQISQRLTLGKLLSEYLPQVDEYDSDMNPTEEATDQLVAGMRDQYDKVIVTTYNGTHNKGQIKLVKDLYERYGDKLGVLALRNPYDIREFEEVGTYIVSYESRELALHSLTQLLIGKIEGKGKLPVSIK